MKLQKDREGKFIAKFFNSRGKPIKDKPVEEILPKKASITVLVECGTLWFAAGSKFGVTWKASQVLVQKTPESMPAFAFQGVALEAGGDDEEEEAPASAASNLIDDEEALAAPAPVKSAVAAMMPKAKPAVAPAPAPAPAKPEANPFESVDVPDGSDHEAEDAEPIPAPVAKKPVATATKIVKKVVKPKA